MKKILVLFVLAGVFLGFNSIAFAACNVNAVITPGNQTVVEASVVSGNRVPTLVTLDGSHSVRADTYSWTQSQSDLFQVTLSNPHTAVTSFTAPDVGSSGATLHFTLTVVGCSGSDSKSNTTNITITNLANQPPVASATVSPEPYALEGELVTLDGSASSDPDGNTLTYNWYQLINGIENWVSSNALWKFNAPNDAYPYGESLTFRLRVSDGHLSSSIDKIVNITWVDDPPEAIIFQCPQSINERSQITLDGSKSTDSDDGIVSYNWNQLVGLPNADLSQVDLSAPSITFSAPTLTSRLHTMKFGLTVTDNYGLRDSAECDILVLDITPPDWSCSPSSSDDSWHSSDVTLNCTANDPGSGLANSDNLPFTLIASISDGSESLDVPTGSQVLCDARSDGPNCTTAGPITGFKIDKKAPQLNSCDAPDGSWHADNVTLGCVYMDLGSGPTTQTIKLTTNIQLGNETNNASASAGGAKACDAVNNCASSPSDIGGNKIDRKAPVINCDPADTLWHATNQSVSCTAADGGSGLANSADASFTLLTSISTGTETATASTDSKSVSDAVGNSATASPVTFKIDMKAPQLSSCGLTDGLWHNDDVTLKCTYTDGGSGPESQDVSLSTNVAAGTETSNAVASASGAKACDAVNNCAPSPSDIGGNKIDRKTPTDITFVGGGIADGGIYYWGFVPASPTECKAIDGGSGLASCTVTGYDTTIGNHILTATATDKVGNKSTLSWSYEVKAWTLKGFYQPVEMNGVYNLVKNGSTVPLKFEIFAGPTELTDIAHVKSLTYAQNSCDATATTDEIEPVATGGTVLRYDVTAGQFIYNWKTPNTAGKCYRVTMTTQDGSGLVAFFKTK